jgi:ribosome maturation factor RimP
MRQTKHPVVANLEDEVSRTLAGFGYELVLMKFGGPVQRPTLTVHMDKPGGVTSGDCQYMAERLSVLLDALDPIPGSYNLVVSSPGVNRPLVRDEDFERFAGQDVAVTFRGEDGKRATVTGKLQGLEAEQVVLLAGDAATHIPLAQIEQARLEHNWDDV